MPIKKCRWRHCSFSLSRIWTARLMNYLQPTVCKFPISYSNFDCLQYSKFHADGKGILVTANYRQMPSPCMEYNKWSCYNGRLESLLTLRLSTVQSKGIVLFLVMWTVAKTHQLLLANAQALEQLQLLQYSKLQIAMTMVKASVQYLCPSWQPAMHGQIQSTYMNMLQEKGSLCKCIQSEKWIDMVLV